MTFLFWYDDATTKASPSRAPSKASTLTFEIVIIFTTLLLLLPCLGRKGTACCHSSSSVYQYPMWSIAGGEMDGRMKEMDDQHLHKQTNLSHLDDVEGREPFCWWKTKPWDTLSTARRSRSTRCCSGLILMLMCWFRWWFLAPQNYQLINTSNTRSVSNSALKTLCIHL